MGCKIKKYIAVIISKAKKEKTPEEIKRYQKMLANKDVVGVFQLESEGMQTLCKRIGLSVFEEIIALIALYRPGPMQFIDQFIEAKKDPSKMQVPHPLLKDLVTETYGVLVYQEQVMKIVQVLAGYTLARADAVRKMMIQGLPIMAVWKNCVILLGMTAVILAVSLKKFKDKLE